MRSYPTDIGPSYRTFKGRLGREKEREAVGESYLRRDNTLQEQDREVHRKARWRGHGTGHEAAK